MTLTPIKTERIFKSADPEFNHKAAKAAYDLVMKMDEDEARMFTSIVVADMTEEIIEKNLRTVQAHVDQIVSKRITDMKRAVISKAAGNPDSVPFAQALAVIEKAQRPWDENKYRRDQGGRFATKVSHSQTRPINDKTAAAMGIKPHPNGLKGAKAAQYQDEYRQLASFLGAVHASSSSPGDTDIFLHFRDKRTGQEFVERASGTRAKPSMLDPGNATLERIEARPNTINVGGAAFGLTQSLGESGVQNVNALTNQGNIRQFSDDWMREDTHNSNVRTYGRIKAGSEYLGRVAPAGSKMQMATSFGEFVGNMGPEAERVMGPTARKTAYRYRGTEKTPDKRLAGAYGRAIGAAKLQNANDPYRGTREGQKANLKNPRALAPTQMAAARISAERRAPTFEERADGRAVIQTYLKQKMPNRSLYELQLASGNTPPSQGVMLNKDGQIVSEAVGYGDDHYIPFNLKNLKALKGGEYIRTRSVGGLTSEDIYVGLMAGAKQVTVVSRSGTFTLTFEDDFKGGRRHNDKARRMTRRYEQILDAVQSEQIDRGQVDDRIISIIEADVEKDLGEFANYRTKREEVKRRVKAYKEDPELTPEDEMLIRELSNRARADGTSPDAKDYRRQITGRILAQKQTRYRLDGPGYEAALEALEEQFPYYITVKSVPEDAQDVASYERDKGYVEPGRNRPTAARAGLYGTQVNPGQKFSASHADFQSGRAPVRSNVGTPQAQPAEASTTTAPEAAPAAEPKADTKTVSATFPTAAMAVSDRLKEVLDISGLDSEDTKIMSYTVDDLRDPAKADKFNTLANQLVEQTPNGLGDTWTQYQQATGQFGKKPYDKTLRGMWSNAPFAFPGDAYTGSNIDAKRNELKRIDSEVPSSVYSTKKYSEMTDQDMTREFNGLLQVYNTIGALESPEPSVLANALRAAGVDPQTPGVQSLISDPKTVHKKIGRYLDELHKTQAVKAGVAPEVLNPPKSDPVIHTGDGSKPERTGKFESDLLHFAAEILSDNGDHDRAGKLYEAADAISTVAPELVPDVLKHYDDLTKATLEQYGQDFYKTQKKSDA